jgi:hypothetical protein
MIGIETILASPVISALSVSAFYLATYLSFVGLLRLPRNWIPLTLPSVLVSVSLTIITVALISFSSQGFNLPAFVLSTGFIAGLFSIIAAPAIAFKPGAPRPVVEFLAKHARFAGLSMILPAIVIGYALPDAKLYGLLVTAIAIELAWFVRHRGQHRQIGQRKSYPIVGHDLQVLKTQANGDIEGFAKRHNIRELQLSPDGSVNWLGCNKDTRPCPFNLYVNRLGLNTAPCCREHLRELSNFVAACLQDMGAEHWLEGGSLLGAVRENGALLAWEDDVDISVLLDGETTWETLTAAISKRCAKEGYYVDIFEHKRSLAISYDPQKTWPFHVEHNRMRGEIRLDLVAFRHATNGAQSVLERESHKGVMPVMESGWYGVPKELVLPTSTINFLGDTISCPNQPDAYLRVLYGEFEKIELTYVDADAARTRAKIDTIDDVPA